MKLNIKIIKEKVKKVLPQDKNTWILCILSLIVSVVLVSSMCMQIRSVDKSKEEDIESLRDDEIKAGIQTYKTKYEESTEKYQDNMNKIQEYEKTAKQDEESSKVLDKEIDESKMLLGLTDVTGEGVILTLKNTEDAEYTSENLRYLVNELKYAGAEAISINDNRIINLADIVTLNESFITMYKGSVRLSEPYIVKAIGDKNYLSSTLNAKNSGFIDQMKSYNLDVELEESDKITILKYPKEISARGSYD